MRIYTPILLLSTTFLLVSCSTPARRADVPQAQSSSSSSATSSLSSLSAIPAGVHIAYLHHGRMVYDGKDLGSGTLLPLLSGKHVAYVIERFDPKTSVYDPQLNYDGKDLGSVFTGTKDMGAPMFPILAGDSIAFLREAKAGEYHLIFNGKDLGACDPFTVVVNPEHAACLLRKGMDARVLYDGKVIGTTDMYGIPPVLSGDHIGFVTKGSNDGTSDVVVDGKNIGKGYGVQLDGSHIGFNRFMLPVGQDDATHVFYDGKDLAQGELLPNGLEHGHVAWRATGHIFYDGKDMGIGNSADLSADHIAVYTESGSIFLDGKAMGMGMRPELHGDGVVFEAGRNQVTWNGVLIGEGGYVADGNHILFRRLDDGALFLDGTLPVGATEDGAYTMSVETPALVK